MTLWGLLSKASESHLQQLLLKVFPPKASESRIQQLLIKAGLSILALKALRRILSLVLRIRIKNSSLCPVHALGLTSIGTQRHSDPKVEVSAPAGRLDPYPIGTELVMSFARKRFFWTAAHIPGLEIVHWEQMGDVADCIFEDSKKSLGFPEFLTQLRGMSEVEIDPLPAWVDFELLDDGCRFFVETWPLVFQGFGWAVLGGFGCETASAVLLESRYWAAQGESGQRDTWKRLRETAAWLYDMCVPGAKAFLPGGVAWTSALHVRFLHARTRAMVNAKGTWDSDKFGLPINQGQLIGTLLGSSVLLVQGMEEATGMPVRDRDKEGFTHLWRVIGHFFGIDPVLNPNTSYQRACTIMESVFAFAIPEQPSPAETGKLTQHICESVALGVRENFKAPATGEVVAAPARIFLGEAYGDAICLPPCKRWHYAVIHVRLVLTRWLYSAYFLLPLSPVRQVYKKIMEFAFTRMIESIHRNQQCRYASHLRYESDSMDKHLGFAEPHVSPELQGA
eukprot:gnl/MRDRNA2_/MRDRNA2_36059_c0_seq1.p1 gnl/MRDRNA2_/MRDRNA2_36059_c0~~gnl/MRDRNA2_/MRDRNA2_36059_c0_seq1.p1  ORF type:complete len:508 (+),score=71.37 gnl/MRDRNA2_/MRDRNA2_36059_c0_seq1:75-1598(+)